MTPPPPPLDEIVADIRAAHRTRVYAMTQRQRADAALGAFLRTMLGWSKARPAAERKPIEARAAALVKIGERVEKARAKTARGAAAGHVPEADTEDYLAFAAVIEASIRARAPFDLVEAAAAKTMARRARELPVWPWAADVRGLGPVSLAVIVGEAGDLSGYPDHSKLWKRMGVAVIDGHRQGAPDNNATSADWTREGYAPARRSRLFVVGDVLVKVNGDGRYRQTYLARKAHERARAEAAGLTVAPAAAIPKDRRNEFMSLGHVDNRARRYMEKRLLRDLWQAWRRADLSTPHREAIEIVPAAAPHHSAAAAAQ